MSDYYSFGFTRSDGDFELVATLNNSGKHMPDEVFTDFVKHVKVTLELAIDGHIEVLERQDALDIVQLGD
jgi:cAMP phosphodiesterase